MGVTGKGSLQRWAEALGAIGAAGLLVLFAALSQGLRDNPGATDITRAVAPDSRQGALFVWQAGSTQLFAHDLVSGAVLAEIQLPFQPLTLVPTPGGVSVFVAFEESDLIQVYSAETFELQKSHSTGLSAVEQLSFSPNGDRLWVVHDGGGSVTQYRHQMLEIRDPILSSLVPGEGAMIPNRRGTRLYRGGAHVTTYFGQTLEAIDTWDVAVTQAVFEPGFAELWGIDAQGRAVALEERTGKRIYGSDHPVAPLAPVSDQYITYVAAAGLEIVQFEPRRGTIAHQIQLSFTPTFLAKAGLGLVWALGDNGQFVQILEGQVVGAGTLALEGSGAIGGVVASVVQRDGSFACF